MLDSVLDLGLGEMRETERNSDGAVQISARNPS